MDNNTDARQVRIRFVLWNKRHLQHGLVTLLRDKLLADGIGAITKEVNSHYKTSYTPAQLLVYKLKAKIHPTTGPPFFQSSADIESLVGARLQPEDQISLLLPRGAGSDEYLHAVINALDDPPSSDGSFAEETDILSALRNTYHSTVNNARNEFTPSESAKSQNYRMTQKNLQSAILDGRYHKEIMTAPPIEIYHRAFGQFLTNISSSDPQLEPTPEFVSKVVTFMRTSCKFYDNEPLRTRAVQPLLMDILDTSLADITNPDGSRPDAQGQHVLPWQQKTSVSILIEELKKEVGEANTDVTTQVTFSMRRTWCLIDNDFVRERCCCPTFLLAVGGPWLAILGGVMTDRTIVQRLTDFMWLGISPAEDGRCLRLARVLLSLNRALQTLRHWYNHDIPKFSLHASPSHPRFFPFPTSFIKDKTEQSVFFRYIRPLELDSACVTFLAHVINNPEELQEPLKNQDDLPLGAELIVVKFSRGYGAVAHRLLQQEQLAPELYYTGPVESSRSSENRELTMVVMEYVRGKTANERGLSGPLPHEITKQVALAISVLHNQDLVFGDLRKPNIMITDEDKVKLIDFDWAGKEGEARYPVHISELSWPEGVIAHGLIKKEHDKAMLLSLGHSVTL